MGWTAAAIIGSAAIGAFASSKAASAQKSAAASAGAVSERQYDLTREDLAPWRQIGGRAIDELGALYGFPQDQAIDEGGRSAGSGPGNMLASAFAPIVGGVLEARGRGDIAPKVTNAMAQIGRGGDAGARAIPPPSGNAMITDPRYLNGETIMYGDPRYGDAGQYKGLASVNPSTGAQEFYSDNGMAQYGRNGDTEIAHVTPGETVVPESVANQPDVRNRLAEGFRQEGMDPSRYIVGGRNSLNPYTGNREFFEGYGGSAGDFSDEDARDQFQGPESQDASGASGYGGVGGNRGGGGSDPRRNQPRDRYPTDPTQGAQAGSSLPDDYYSQENAMARFYESPDYRISFDEGAKTIEASAAARGGLFSGNTGTALARYGQDYGNRLYNQYANRLQSFAGFGQTAATQTGQFGAYSAGQQGNALLAGGNAASQGWIGMGNAINAGIGNALYYNQVR